MSRRVDVEVGRSGQVKIEFSGFEGDLCYEEAESIGKILRSLGLKAGRVSITPNTPSEIEAEVGVVEAPRRKVSVS